MKKLMTVGLATILLAGAVLAAYWWPERQPELFTNKKVSPPAGFILPDLAKKHRFVEIAPKMLEDISGELNQVRLGLFDKEQVTLQIDNREKFADEGTISYGTVAGIPDSRVIASRYKEALSIEVKLAKGRTFKIDYVGGNVHQLYELETRVKVDCEDTKLNGEKAFITGQDGKKIPLYYQVAYLEDGEKKYERTSLRKRLRLKTKKNEPYSGGESAGEKTSRENNGAEMKINENGPYSGPMLAGSRAAKKGGALGTSFRAANNTIYGGGGKEGGGKEGGGKEGGEGGGKEGGGKEGGGGGGGGGGDGTIQLMVLFTPEASSEKGGDSGAKALAGTIVGNVQKAFSNSKVSANIKLVHAQLYDYTSTGQLADDVQKLSSSDVVAALRDKHKADLVCLIVQSSEGNTMGIAAALDNKDGNKDAAFSVLKVKAIGSPILSCAHEIGHNLGCMHNKDQDNPGQGPFEYSHGWRFEGSDTMKYRTLLSYQKYDEEDRILYYSNPAVKYKGTATGDASNANNAETINKTAPKVSAYR